MKNIFAFPQLSTEDTQKAKSKMGYIILVILACFIASLFVRIVIKDRIYWSDTAIQPISQSDFENTEGDSGLDTIESPLYVYVENTQDYKDNQHFQTNDVHFVDRISKYALLVIIIVFSMAFYMDMRRRLSINIFQYFLVGISLVLFYLLTLSLGEHTGYLVAYIIASLLTVILNWWYMGTVLDAPRYGTTFGIGLLILYALLYGLMRISSFNLLGGTIILYVILFIFMMGSAKMSRNTTDKTVIT